MCVCPYTRAQLHLTGSRWRLNKEIKMGIDTYTRGGEKTNVRASERASLFFIATRRRGWKNAAAYIESKPQLSTRAVRFFFFFVSRGHGAEEEEDTVHNVEGNKDVVSVNFV